MATFPKPKDINPLAPVIAKRGMTYADATAVELKVLTPEQLNDEMGFCPMGAASGQRLPYFDLDGHPIMDPKTGDQYCRYKIEYQDGFQFPPDFKPLKYGQRKGSSGHISYVPRGVGVDWLAVTADPKEPILFTEGEFKAIAACKMGIATVGLAGIHMIAQQSRKMTVPLENVSWVGRPTPICFDAHETSTAEEPLRPEIEYKAARALANKLTTLGAEPMMVYIARTQTFLKQDPRVKMGIDDFRDAGGTDEELMSTAKPIEHENLILAEMIRDWCVYMGSKPFIMDRATGLYKHGSSDFKHIIVADKQLKIQDGDKIRFIPAGEAFLKSPLRPTFRRMVFDPSCDFGLDQERDHFNTWKGMRTLPALKGPGEFDRDIGLWRKYLTGLVGEQWVEYVEKWVAHIIQRPEEKTTIALVLGGKTEGTGKSLLGAIIGAMVGESYRHSGNFEDFFGDYKGANIDSKLLIQIEESEGVSHARMAKLKDFITNDRVNISIKYTPDYTNDNLARVLITSNALDPIKVEETSRRFFVTRTPLTQEEVESSWREWVGREIWDRFCNDASPDGDWPRKHLMYHLRNVVDLRAWEANAAPPVTEEMEDMIEASSSATDLGMAELYGLLVNDAEGFWILPKQVQSLNSKFWSGFVDYVKRKRGTALQMETRAFGARVDVRVLARPSAIVPTRQESKGKDKQGKTAYRTMVNPTEFGKDEGEQIKAKDRLLEAFGKIAAVIRLDEDHLKAVMNYRGKSNKF